MKPRMHLVETSIFSLNPVLQTNQNYEQSQQKLGTHLENKVHYLPKICPIFVGSVHNFGKSEDDII